MNRFAKNTCLGNFLGQFFYTSGESVKHEEEEEEEEESALRFHSKRK